jgi:hypothetical protein
MKIDPTKKYTTRSGKAVTCLHRAPEGWPTPFPWRGAIESQGTGVWTDDGSFTDMEEPNRFDLIEVREPMRVRLWTRNEVSLNFTCCYDESLEIGTQLGGYTLKEFVEVMP